MAIAQYGKVICEGGRPIVIKDFTCTGYTGTYEILTWAKQCIEESLGELEILRQGKQEGETQ